MKLEDKIKELQANMERYAERMSDWQANADTDAELQALKHAQKLLHALLVVIMKPSINAHLLRYDPMAMTQALEAIGLENVPAVRDANYSRIACIDTERDYQIDGLTMRGLVCVMLRLYDESKGLALDEKRDVAQRMDALLDRAEMMQ